MTGAPLHILVPCKAFSRGKSRLAPSLSPLHREELCRELLNRAIALARAAAGSDAQITVMSADRAVRKHARTFGCNALADAAPGLNGALAGANIIVPPQARLMVLPIDLPHATPGDLAAALALGEHPVIAPDVAGTGTNLLILPPALRGGFRFAFGPGSFARHFAAARAAGHTPAIIERPGLAHDLDLPTDLAALPPVVHPPGNAAPLAYQPGGPA